jgi:mannose-6-phosphate isomerase
MNRINQPLRFERVYLEKIWGGRALSNSPAKGGLGLSLPEGVQVGETWELVDRADVNSIVAEGVHKGRTLNELMQMNSKDLLGRLQATPGGRFPLLVKYIDAAAHLSVQVHPDDQTQHLGADWEAKTEAWVILGATDEGRIYLGLSEAATEADFTAACRAGGQGLEPMLQVFEPEPGQCYFVPGGTIHAIGAGVTLIEVQQNSDTTFRVYDWGRVGLDGLPRDIHIDQALACVDFQTPAPTPVTPSLNPSSCVLASCPAFRMGVVADELAGDTHKENEPVILAVVSGAGTLAVAEQTIEINTGDVWLLPAALGLFHVEGRDLRMVEMRGGAQAQIE